MSSAVSRRSPSSRRRCARGASVPARRPARLPSCPPDRCARTPVYRRVPKLQPDRTLACP
ncbi:hypothetical protein EXZ48_05430 [Shinella sp. JR1-6]|nr:hypothetical protein EXZ48_05430 [Shinella sp. JR1-6]